MTHNLRRKENLEKEREVLIQVEMDDLADSETPKLKQY
jgi:hypothetical protein